MSLKTTITCLVLCLATGCTRHNDTLLYNYQRTADEAGWARTDTLLFPLQPVPATATYSLDVGLRMRPNFPYQGLTFVLELSLQNPQVVLKDTIQFSVADSAGTRLPGQGHSLITYEKHALNLHLFRGQRGSLRLYHLMAQSPLPAITDVGVKLKAAE